MRQIPPYSLWVGNIDDVRNIRDVLSAGICALVDLAADEPPPESISRDLLYCRFPLVDGAGNPPWIIRTALENVVSLLRCNVATLVCCSAGMSRSPAIASGALAIFTGNAPQDCLRLVAQHRAGDVSPALWRDVIATLASVEKR